jgi:hypothetical protein
MAEMSEKEYLLILNKYGYNFDVRKDIVDSSDYRYRQKKKISALDLEISSKEELEAAFEQFKKDLDEDKGSD